MKKLVSILIIISTLSGCATYTPVGTYSYEPAISIPIVTVPTYQFGYYGGYYSGYYGRPYGGYHGHRHHRRY
jgi:hypothetical protein